MTRDARASEIEDYIAYLDALVDHVRASCSVASGSDAAASHLHVLGFSQGAATASRWAVQGQTAIDRLTLWAGDLAYDLDLETHAERLRMLDLTVVVGSGDPYVSPDRQEALRDRLATHKIPVVFRSFDGGHRLHRATLHALAS
jgi:predicted esterase